jgi:signal transduction histidine kinase
MRPDDMFCLKEMRETFKLFFLSTGFSVGIFEQPSGLEIFGIGVRDICAKFHRTAPESLKCCIESNLSLTKKLNRLGEFEIQECKNGIMYGLSPIIVKSKHIANIFFGRVLFERPDIARFKKQADTFGYDVDQYLKALKKVPVVSKKKFKDGISFIGKLSVMFSESLTHKLNMKEKERELDQEAYKNIEQEQRLRLFATEMPLIKEQERREIGTELHDSIGQNLALARLKLAELINSPSCKCVSKTLKDIDRLTSDSINSTRKMTFELGIPLLYDVGLEPALEWLIENYREDFGLACRLKRNPELISMDENVRVLLYHAVRELLVNILKHAKATRAKVSINKNGKAVKIDIEDNGVGFDTSQPQKGMGLFCVRERLAHIGGQFHIKSSPGKGSRFTLISPLSNSKKARKNAPQLKKPAPRVNAYQPRPETAAAWSQSHGAGLWET